MPLKEIHMPAGSGPHATPRGVPRCGATPTPASFMQRIRERAPWHPICRFDESASDVRGR